MIRLYVLLFLVFFLAGAPSHAGLTITFPSSHTVIQRNQQGQGLFFVGGTCTLPYDKIEARLVSLTNRAAADTSPWVTLTNSSEQGSFRGTITASGGWYTLEVRGILEQRGTDTTSVRPVGIGEVFLVAGHSNAMGLPRLGSKDASEQVVSYNALNKYLNSENITVAPDGPMPLPGFGRFKADHFAFPAGEAAWNWGELGSRLVERLGVPVLFMNAGWAAANSINWREASEGKNTRNIYVGKDWPNRQPYANLINTLRYYHSWLGIRAVLWFHGENDAAHLGISEQDYYNNIRALIDHTRKDFGYAMPWALALCTVSLNSSAPYLPVLNAQIRLAESPGFNAWRGPYTDTIQVPRPAHGHFENVPGGTQGLTQVALAWNRTLTDAFFSQRAAHTVSTHLFTGVVPRAASPGHTFVLPYYVQGSSLGLREVEGQLLTEKGEFVATVGTSTQSPLRVILPTALPQGKYRVRVVAKGPPLVAGDASEPFEVVSGLPAPQLIRSLKSHSTPSQVLIYSLVAADPDLTRIVLERSDDREVFQAIGTIAPSGRGPVLYTLTDPQPTAHTAYYRIRLESHQSPVQYSPLIAVFKGDTPSLLAAFPNPAPRGAPIYIRTDFLDEFSYQLFNSQGVPVGSELFRSSILGLSLIQPDVALPPGLYLLQTTRGAETQTQRIVIK